MRENKSEKVGVIGAGWYGSHIALCLRKQGYEVSLFEKNPLIFGKISGKFGVRLHAGPHYPRSSATRKGCREGYIKFFERYPELINQNEYAIYGLGIRDSNNDPPKVNKAQFLEVCREFKINQEIIPEKWGYKNLFTAVNLEEPSISVGKKLRDTFEKLLRKEGVKIYCNFTVIKIKKKEGRIIIFNARKGCYEFDYLINATSYQSLLTTNRLPFSMEIFYQPCLALVYIDKKKPKIAKPFSFIVMDGWFPCLMPYIDGEENSRASNRRYILTHGKWTILGSYKTVSEAEYYLSSIDDNFVEKYIKPHCEAEIIKFWPEFEKRFQYSHWVGDVLAKIKTEREFRSAVTFQDKLSDVIHIIPGKVSNIFDVEREVIALIKKENILTHGNFLYIKNGVLYDASHEIADKPKNARNTCSLQPYAGYLSRKKEEKLIRDIGFFSTARPEKKLDQSIYSLDMFFKNKNLKKEKLITMKNYKKITGLDVVVSSNFGVIVQDKIENNEESSYSHKKN